MKRGTVPRFTSSHPVPGAVREVAWVTLEKLSTFIICVFLSVAANIICNAIRNIFKKRDDIPNYPRRYYGCNSFDPPVLPPGRTSPPQMPVKRNAQKRSSVVIRTPDTFPRCPRCRARNREGEAQKVFWDSQSGRFKCSTGHYFNA